MHFCQLCVYSTLLWLTGVSAVCNGVLLELLALTSPEPLLIMCASRNTASNLGYINRLYIVFQCIWIDGFCIVCIYLYICLVVKLSSGCKQHTVTSTDINMFIKLTCKILLVSTPVCHRRCPGSVFMPAVTYVLKFTVNSFVNWLY